MARKIDKTGKVTKSRAAQARDIDDDDDLDDLDDDIEDSDGGAHLPLKVEDEDPSWWAPHVVMGLLILVGVLGFFGTFNSVLGFLKAEPVTEESTTDGEGEAEAAPSGEVAPAPEKK